MSINKELMKGSTTILILNLLERKPMYGYEMAKEMERLSNGLFLFKEGTLYPILHALESEGSIEAYWEMKDGRKRKYYKLLDRGRQKLQEKKQEWRLFRSTVDHVLGEG
ncbi:PadR family transcriptional regulator [Paenibacillus aquistagni]|uniref:DNA-binding transcriptional regulator, PadR family n=1 Tax=Paenibacillus aquistagni TaxID=1852522 RepID=A0A1X7LSR0_9BACL|nr:PadR family transcriptional regulator [Paenibacillus aquistagni]NMM52088.1 PadR family transcriptional regulator [Paenibacillus aquistagni]SMG56282.1 DNA-binding transcriptional regulator, PadR family [Paenibacillus aquistagni]